MIAHETAHVIDALFGIISHRDPWKANYLARKNDGRIIGSGYGQEAPHEHFAEAIAAALDFPAGARSRLERIAPTTFTLANAVLDTEPPMPRSNLNESYPNRPHPLHR
ncbi:MAG: hypothetical protein ACYDA1_02475 [Vulcanimicrobiaceae bacterium]